MTEYSQYGEQRLILEFFKDQKEGILWDIGAGDGMINSNTRKLFEKGWDGYFFEASFEAFKALQNNYRNDRDRAVPIYCAVRNWDGIGTLWEHPTLPGWSSCDEDWARPWIHEAYISHPFCLSLRFLSTALPHPDFLSIDIEGKDAEVLASMPEDFRPRLIVAEVDKPNAEPRIDGALFERGYTKIWRTIGNAGYAIKA